MDGAFRLMARVGGGVAGVAGAMDLEGLRALLRQRAGGDASRVERCVPTGWGDVDAALGYGGLACRATHEWLGGVDVGPSWLPATLLLTHLAGNAARAGGPTSDAGAAGTVVWIGQRVWPGVHALARVGLTCAATTGAATPGAVRTGAATTSAAGGSGGGGAGRGTLLERSLFVDASTPDLVAWAADVALRAGGVAAVVADGSGLDMAASRRLQLAAEAGGSIGLLARPERDEGARSAAMTRWRVRSCVSGTTRPRWLIELRRCKGSRLQASSQPGVESGPQQMGPWAVEYDHAAGSVTALSVVGDRRDAAADGLALAG